MGVEPEVSTEASAEASTESSTAASRIESVRKGAFLLPAAIDGKSFRQ
jgi:hypothetical protein